MCEYSYLFAAGHTRAAPAPRHRAVVPPRKEGRASGGKVKPRPDPSPVLGIKAGAELLANVPAGPGFSPAATQPASPRGWPRSLRDPAGGHEKNLLSI